MNRIISVAAGALTLATVCSAQLPYSQAINPKATYLRTINDPTAVGATPIDLLTLGLLPGDTVFITRRGDFSYSGLNTEDDKGMVGVFSGSSVLLPTPALNRVQDAIDAGIDFVTFNTLQLNIATDILEDFRVSTLFNPDPTSTVSVQMPAGATHLFVAAHDTYYSDNSDLDSDFGVDIAGERAVSVDVKPETTDNTINRNSKQVAVAILGSATVDVLALDAASIRFAGASIRQKNNGSLHYEIIDINLDGTSDLVAHFNVESLVLAPEATSAEITGNFTNGLQIRGSDSIRMVP